MTGMSRTTRRVWVALTQMVILVGLFGLWQFAPDGVLDEFLVSRPNLIAAQASEWLGNGVLIKAATATLRTIFYGLMLGSVSGMLLGVVSAMFQLAFS